MWAMFLNSVRLFFRGKLFRDPVHAFRQWLVCFALTLAAIILLVKVGLALWLSVIVVAIGAGLLQPVLFRNLKYA